MKILTKNDLIYGFIATIFPVMKIRDKNTFKRAIKITRDVNGTHTIIIFLNEPKFKETAYHEIIPFVKTALGYSTEEINFPLISYLHKIK